jgi:serralysin
MLNANSPNRSLHSSYENIARNVFSGLNLTNPSASTSATLALLRQNGYTIDRVFNDPVTDLQAIGLISTTKPPLLVFNGTSSALDEQDNRHPQGAGFGQFTQNQAAISNWLSAIANNTTKNPQRLFPDVIGHSLGGALAQQTAAALPTLISEVVTFESFGLNAGITNKFTQSGGIASQVTHYITSGDIVSLEGQEFIGGAAVLATYTTPAIDPQNFIDKHFTSIVGITPNSATTQPANISYQEIGTTVLNNPNFTYTDRDWHDLILSLRQTDPQLAQGLSSRQSSETLRTQYSYFELVNKINQSDLAGRYLGVADKS